MKIKLVVLITGIVVINSTRRKKNIVSELSNYDLKGKIIYCNCDRPTVSNFYKFFKNNFNDLGLKGLYASYYDDNPLLAYFNGSQETLIF